MIETVTISKEVYEQLVEDSIWLGHLDAAGVDNWGGIGYAYELAEEDENQEDD
jgi:hypothetical protein|tara:strand:- start:351 stop:509 length:159 start_codon:yes stop_codon:yes gene_type:complete